MGKYEEQQRIREALLIVRTYGYFLEQHSSEMVFDAMMVPESLLPYSVKKIEESFDILESVSNPKEFEKIQAARGFLVSVMPDKEARGMNKKLWEHKNKGDSA